MSDKRADQTSGEDESGYTVTGEAKSLSLDHDGFEDSKTADRLQSDVSSEPDQFRLMLERIANSARRVWSILRRDSRKHPLAALGIVIALIPLVVGAVKIADAINDEALRTTLLPPNGIAVGVGQLTSPSVMIPRPLDEIPRPPNTAGEGSQDMREWAYELGGVDAETTVVSFRAESDLNQRILITDVQVKVLERRPPMQGTWIAPDGAGGAPLRILRVDLDSDPPSSTREHREQEEPWNFPLWVSQDEFEVFSVIASTGSCDCSWVIELYYVEDGEQKRVIINKNGEPFRTTATNNATDETFAPRIDSDPWPR